MAELLLKVTDLAKYFGERVLYSGIGFEIRRGEKVGFVGPNGAGKTTLLRCLLDEERSDGGQVTWFRSCAVGYVRQEVDFGGRTVLEELKQAYQDVLAWEAHMRQIEAELAALGDNAPTALLTEYAEVMARFEHVDGELEDWTESLQTLCPACGLGDPDEAAHDHDHEPDDAWLTDRRFGIAVRDERDLEALRRRVWLRRPRVLTLRRVR